MRCETICLLRETIFLLRESIGPLSGPFSSRRDRFSTWRYHFFHFRRPFLHLEAISFLGTKISPLRGTTSLPREMIFRLRGTLSHFGAGQENLPFSDPRAPEPQRLKPRGRDGAGPAELRPPGGRSLKNVSPKPAPGGCRLPGGDSGAKRSRLVPVAGRPASSCRTPFCVKTDGRPFAKHRPEGGSGEATIPCQSVFGLKIGFSKSMTGLEPNTGRQEAAAGPGPRR